MLVGNFGFNNSEINAFNPTTGTFEGTIPIDVGSGNTPGGLWALDFGIGGNNGSPNTLYFTDGINGQNDGLFGAISLAPTNNDFTGTGVSDGLFQNVNNGQVYEWQLNGTTINSSGFVGNNTDPTWHAVATGDFTGNGIDDILFQNVNSGQVYEWETNGTSVLSSGFVGNNTDPTWLVVGTGYFTGNGIADTIFQNVNTGQVYEWEMNGDIDRFFRLARQ